jgi:acetylornithine deacetylase/succinyl-diaminopimelate desuccinylase-like protein
VTNAVATETGELPAVAALCSELIQYDTSCNGPGERACAERVAAELSAVGLTPEVYEAVRYRSNVLARLEGSDPAGPGLLVQMHLDVVPAVAGDWQVAPFAGEVRDGHVWGRGAVDMKNMVAMVLAALRSLRAAGWRPRRSIVFAFLADEEMGGGLGASWLVTQKPDLFAGCTEAIGEAGGFSYEYAEGRRAFLVQTGEKGVAQLRLVARGSGGHGSFHHDSDPITTLAEAITRLSGLDTSTRFRPSSERLVSAAREWSTQDDAEQALAGLGPLGPLLRPVLRNTFRPTVFKSGFQHNVVPSAAEAIIDARLVPGSEDGVLDMIRDRVGSRVEVEILSSSRGVEVPFSGPVPTAIRAAIGEIDPGAVVVPTLLPIGTDAKHFSKLGIRCFGFAPLKLPSGYEFSRMFHGVDERVPISALSFGQDAMEAFLARC